MAKSRDLYQISQQQDLPGALTRLNFILAKISDRLDQIEGIRGAFVTADNAKVADNLEVGSGVKFIDGGISRVGGADDYMEMDESGKVLFRGGGGLAFAEINAEDNLTETAIVTQDVPVQVTIFDTNGEANNATPDHTNDRITIDNAGKYLVTVSATVDSVAGAASRFEMSVQKNSGAESIIAHVNRNISGGGGETGVVAMIGVADLAAKDTVEVWMANETNTQNYVVNDISLSVVQIGGN